MKRRTWKFEDRRKFQAEAIAIIEENCPECKMVNTITGQIFDCLVFNYPKEE